ncbi:LysR family transcriptional regulator, partial [Serratia marcescens]|nr:LysR family transcriptional regulator [Serratia marcescens]
MRLTPGKTLFAGVHGAAERRRHARGLLTQQHRSRYCVSVTHSFAALWLVPRQDVSGRTHTIWCTEACAGIDAAGRQRGRGGALQPRAVSALRIRRRGWRSFGVYAAPGWPASRKTRCLITVKWGDSA